MFLIPKLSPEGCSWTTFSKQSRGILILLQNGQFITICSSALSPLTLVSPVQHWKWQECWVLFPISPILWHSGSWAPLASCHDTGATNAPQPVKRLVLQMGLLWSTTQSLPRGAESQTDYLHCDETANPGPSLSQLTSMFLNVLQFP